MSISDCYGGNDKLMKDCARSLSGQTTGMKCCLYGYSSLHYFPDSPQQTLVSFRIVGRTLFFCYKSVLLPDPLEMSTARNPVSHRNVVT